MIGNKGTDKMMVNVLDRRDHAVDEIASALEAYESSHADAECSVYRYNPAAIRIRIVDQSFRGLSKGDRHDYAWGFLRSLSEDTTSQISVLLCLEPGEKSMMETEFDNPSRSLI